MKIPNQIRAFGIEWNVSWDQNVATEGSCYGSTHHSSQKIFLDPTTTGQKNEQTFIHELLHVSWDATGLTANKKFGVEDEELIVKSLANAMYHILKDNDLLKDG